MVVIIDQYTKLENFNDYFFFQLFDFYYYSQHLYISIGY